jgi:hypothetical protein
MLNGSYWCRFETELNKKRRGMRTRFWDKGFDILQNIDDRLTMQKHGKRPTDEIDRLSKVRTEFETGSKKRKRALDDDLLDLSELNDD